MHPLKKKIAALLNRKHLIPRQSAVVVGVSGGPDSMALLHVLATLSLELDFRLIAASMDHGLRPHESTRELALVKDLAQSLNIPFETTAVDSRAAAREQKLSLEHAARILRYAFLEDICRKYHAHRIAVAHTADDQAEELLLRLIRGTGKKGLAGMLMQRGKIIRPLLTIPKTEILAYLQDTKTAFAEDGSNTNRRFLRNRVRHDLLPLLEEKFSRGIKKNLLQTATILQEEEAFFQDVADRLYSITVTPAGENTAAQKPDRIIDLDRFNHAHPAIQRRVLEMVFIAMGATPGFRQIEQILALCGPPGQGERLHFAEGLRVRKNANLLTFSYPTGRGNQQGNLVDSEENIFTITLDGPGEIIIPGTDRKLVFEIIPWRPTRSELAKESCTFLDLSQCSFPLTLRSRQPGDRFHPFGAPGTRKVADFLTDQKLTKTQKIAIAVLEKDGRILALPGLRPDHSCRINLATKQVLAITVQGCFP